MTGTRIIYNEGSDEKSVRLTNLARIPYAVQVWVDNDLTKDIATDETSDFIVTPQVFKIEPNTRQMVKIIKLANNLPNDVESLYYFNFSQIPATTEENSNQSQLSILFTSRMKLFYRPKSLLNEPNPIDKLVISFEKNTLKVENRSPFYIVIKNANIIVHKKEISLVNSETLAPKSVSYWNVPFKINKSSMTHVQFEVINDYGSSQTYNKKIN